MPLAIILGLLAVRYRNGWVDKLISGLALASTSLPEFFIGYLLVYFFAVKLADASPASRPSMTACPSCERMQAIALPATALTLVVLAHMMRMTRAAILNVMQSAYVETAELKGLSAFDVIRKHAFPNAIAPIINVVMLNLAYPGRRRRRGRGDLRLSRHGPVSGRPCRQARRAGGAGRAA